MVFRTMLRLGGYMNFAIGLAHVALFLAMLLALDQLNAVMGTVGAHIGPPAGGWVGWIKLLLMVVGVAAFVGFLGLYGLSGAGCIRRLPLLRPGLICISAVFLLHGTFDSGVGLVGRIGELGVLVAKRDPRLFLALIPLTTLTVGLLYLVGTIGLWKTLASSNGTRSDRGPSQGGAA
jgi:hypothetical protein